MGDEEIKVPNPNILKPQNPSSFPEIDLDEDDATLEEDIVLLRSINQFSLTTNFSSKLSLLGEIITKWNENLQKPTLFKYFAS